MIVHHWIYDSSTGFTMLITKPIHKAVFQSTSIFRYSSTLQTAMIICLFALLSGCISNFLQSDVIHVRSYDAIAAKKHQNKIKQQQTTSNATTILLTKLNKKNKLKYQKIYQQGVYRVQKGDTLYKIAKNLQLPLNELITLNQLKAPFLLQTGQELSLPKKTIHSVAKGETLSDIAYTYQVSMAALARDNDLKAPWVLQINQKLYIPGRLVLQSNSAKSSNLAHNNVPVPHPQPSSIAQQSIKHKTQQLPKRTSKSFLWPVQGKIIAYFGPGNKGVHNDGINIAVSEGSAVYAVENGIVAYNGNEFPGLGNILLIRHADGYISVYAHNSKTIVKRGQHVTRGQVIAHAGSTGNVEKAQLHFELRKGNRALNPIKYLKS